ncbi:putative ribonuclease H-like domain-containing protein [Tanacetum coccineum]|uniref:Ribonuclease H-like domain-containing protein n=1 Tax=Tanacetum coccineum TaxID=301880 RepID=A0ABQ4YF64_9ASTR
MSNYIKNQEGGHSIKKLKSLSFEQVKEIFETTMRKVQSFVPMGSELKDLVKERFSTTEPTGDKEKELWVELKRLFEPDNDDTLWKLQRVNNVTTTGPKAVVSAAIRNGEMLLSPQHARFGDQQEILLTITPKIVDHTCLKNLTMLIYKADSRSPKGGKITGKGKIKTGKLDFEDVYFVKELKFNLFSVSQMCDKKNSVLFTETECLVLSPDFKLLDESQVLLKVPRQNNMYSFDLKNVVPSGGLTCLFAKATIDESNLWHRRLGHINFKTMNKLVRGNLVRGLPSKLFENDHTCVACQKGKQHKASCKTKLVSSISQPLQMLHMDLFGPTSSLEDAVADDAGKKTNEDPAKEDDKSGQGEATNTNSTNRLNTVSSLINIDANGNSICRMFTPVNVAGSSCDNLSRSIPINAATLPNVNLPTDPLMPDLEDTNDLLNTGIFSGAYDDKDVGVEANLNNLEITMNISPIPTTRIYKDHPKEQIIGDPLSTPQTRRMTKSAQEHAMVYRNKKDKRGIVVRNKAKLVAQGYTQEEGINYDKVFALVARIEAIRLFFAYASFIGFIVYQMDVKSAFLYGNIEEEVYVDDIIFGSTKKSLCTEFESLMHKKFQMSSMREVIFFLGLQVMQRDDGIFISQDKYVADILKKIDFSSVKTASTLIETNKALHKDEGAFQVTPKVSHLHAVKRIFRYLKGQPKLGLWYPRDSPFDLEAFSDSDYAGASLDRKSTIGGCQFLGKRLISWQCKKQTVVANSTTEAEYVVVANCCGQVLWIQNQMLDYGFNFMNTKIYIDNESTICIVKNPVFHSKTKNIEIRRHFIRDYYEKKLIQVIKIHTDHNVTDLLTKAFDVKAITALSSSQLKKTHKPRKAKRTTKISQSSGPIHLVADETVYKEWEDRMERAATTASSLEAEHDSGNTNRTQSMETLHEPLPQGIGSGSDPTCQVTILGVQKLKLERVNTVRQLLVLYCDQHNMVALLEKTDGSEGFHQIVDFLNASYIRFALSENPTIYDSHIKQFWQTAIVNTLDNGEQEITATVDGHGEGSAIPTVSQYTPLMASSTEPHPDTSAQSSITEPHTSSPQLTKPPTSSTITETIRQKVEIPQSNFPTQTPVANEAAFTGVDVVHGGATTTGWGSGNITKSPTMPHDSPLPGGHTLRSDEGSMTLHELTVLCTNLSNKVERLETKLKQTKQTYGAAFTKLIKKVKKLEQTVKISQARRRTKIIASDDEEDLVVEDPSKQGRSLIEEMDLDAEISLVPPHIEVQRSTFVSTASPQRHADTTVDDLTLAETLMKIKKSAAKANGKAKMDETKSLRKMKQREQVQISRDAEVAQKLQEEFDAAERQRMAQVHQAAQGFIDAEWDDVLARVAADEDFVQQLQAGEKCSEEDLPMKLVELVNQRKKFFAQQRAEAKRNKPMTPAQQKEYMSNYIKNQEGGYSIKQLKSLSFEQVKEIFETTMRKVQSFVPMGSELEVQRLKRAGEESAEKEKELLEEELQKLVGNHTDAYQIFAEILKKFDRDDLVKLWDLVKERFNTTEPTDDKEKELWVELKRLFEPDNDATLWKLQRNIFVDYGCEDDLLDMMKIEYMHKYGDVFEDHSWENHVLTLPEFAVLLRLYSESDVQHRLFETHFSRLMTNDKGFNHEAYWSRIGQPRTGTKKLADIRDVWKDSMLMRNGYMLEHSMSILHHLVDEAKFAYPPYEPPNVPPYPYLYVAYPHPYIHYPDIRNPFYRGGQYGAPGNDYLFTGAMPSHRGTLIISSSGYDVGGSSRGVQDEDDDDDMSD